jgi:hypothetical protein
MGHEFLRASKHCGLAMIAAAAGAALVIAIIALCVALGNQANRASQPHHHMSHVLTHGKPVTQRPSPARGPSPMAP